MVCWEGYASDESMGTFAPIVLYWVYAGFYQLLPPLDNYRLHTKREEEEKNSVPLASVVKGVLLQQVVQATVAQGLFLVSLFSEPFMTSINLAKLQIVEKGHIMQHVEIENGSKMPLKRLHFSGHNLWIAQMILT